MEEHGYENLVKAIKNCSSETQEEIISELEKL